MNLCLIVLAVITGCFQETHRELRQNGEAPERKQENIFVCKYDPVSPEPVIVGSVCDVVTWSVTHCDASAFRNMILLGNWTHEDVLWHLNNSWRVKCGSVPFFSPQQLNTATPVTDSGCSGSRTLDYFPPKHQISWKLKKNVSWSLFLYFVVFVFILLKSLYKWSWLGCLLLGMCWFEEITDQLGQ